MGSHPSANLLRQRRTNFIDVGPTWGIFFFQTVKSYRLPNQTAIGPIRRQPQHMLDTLPSDSPFKEKQLEVLELADPLIPTQTSDFNPSEGEKSSKKGDRNNFKSKKCLNPSPDKVKAIKRTKPVNPLNMIHKPISYLTRGLSSPNHPLFRRTHQSIPF